MEKSHKLSKKNYATSPKLYRSSYPLRSRELVSPVCGIFHLSVCMSACLFVSLSACPFVVLSQFVLSLRLCCFALYCLPKSICQGTGFPGFQRFWPPGHIGPISKKHYWTRRWVAEVEFGVLWNCSYFVTFDCFFVILTEYYIIDKHQSKMETL